MKILTTLFISFFLFIQSSYSAEDIAPELLNVAKVHLLQNFSIKDIKQSLMRGSWNADKSAIAVTLYKPKKTVVFIFIQQDEKKYKAVDISQIEDGNLGKLGMARRMEYSKIETIPTEWRNRDDSSYQVVLRTRVWKDGQRYTVYEELIITANGTPLWR